MAVRQYIGARYVPKFFEHDGSSEWVSGLEYEPLTIVTYLGNSYTSKKPVPSNIGSPNTNTEYWCPTGNYNSQVEAYRQQVLTLESDVRYVEDELSNVQIDMAAAETNIENLQKANQRNYILIGDSYALGTHSNWTQKLKDLLTGSTVWRLQDSGAGFVNGEFLDMITGWVNSHPNNVYEVTDVVVCGGANDSISTLNNLATAMPAFSSYVHTNIPNAKIWIGFIGWVNRNSDVFANRTPSYQRQAYNYYTNKALHGMDYLNGVTMVCHNMDYMQSDGIHPNTDGGDAIANAVYQALMNGFATIARYDNIEGYSVSGGTLNGTVYQSISGDLILIYHGDLTFTFTTHPTITNEWVTLATDFVLPYSDGLQTFQIWANVRDDSDNMYKQKHLQCRVTGGNLQVRLDESETASAWKAITTSQIRIYANTHVFDGILATN